MPCRLRPCRSMKMHRYPGFEMTVQLVEHGCLSCSPLPVKHDRRVTVPSDQVPLDEGEDVFAAVEHLSAGDGASAM